MISKQKPQLASAVLTADSYFIAIFYQLNLKPFKPIIIGSTDFVLLFCFAEHCKA
jgi:hypothetical protein